MLAQSLYDTSGIRKCSLWSECRGEAAGDLNGLVDGRHLVERGGDVGGQRVIDWRGGVLARVSQQLMPAGAELLKLLEGDAIHGGGGGAKRVPTGQPFAAGNEVLEQLLAHRQQDSGEVGPEFRSVALALLN